MEKDTLSELMTFTSVEKLYKKMHVTHPECHFEEAKSLEELDSISHKLEEYQYLFHKNPENFPTSPVFRENMFLTGYDVAIRIHDRYSPCFIHAHDFFEITYVLSGSCTNYIAGQKLIQNQGDLCIISLNTPHAASVFSDDAILIDLLVRSSTFSQAFLGTLSQKGIISSFFSRALYAPTSEAYLLFQTGKDLEISTSILELYSEFKFSKRYSELLLNTLVTTLFIKLLRNHEQNLTVSNPSGHGADSNIMFIMNYIQFNYKTLTLKELSSFFNYSERQMTRILKDYTGKSFITIIQNTKIQRACDLLRNSNLSIQTIIDMAGYSNSHHFYNVFQKHHNMTPAAYRKAFSEENT